MEQRRTFQAIGLLLLFLVAGAMVVSHFQQPSPQIPLAADQFEYTPQVQELPVASLMPIMPEDQMTVAGWNFVVVPNKGLRIRNIPSLYGLGVGTTTGDPIYLEQVVYRDVVPTYRMWSDDPNTEIFTLTDFGYYGRVNYWTWIPLCIRLSATADEVCYTDWRPAQ